MAAKTVGFAIADEDRAQLDELVAIYGAGNRSEFLRVAMRRMRRDLLSERMQQVQAQARHELNGRVLTADEVRDLIGEVASAGAAR